MKPENRNLIVAVLLSMSVLFGWQMIVAQPEMEREQARLALLAEQQAADNAAHQMLGLLMLGLRVRHHQELLRQVKPVRRR